MLGFLEGVTAAAVIKIIVIDLVLSGDNAVVIAMAVKSLPSAMARKAAIMGAFGAVGLRIAFTIAAAKLLNVPYLQAIGGVILFWIAYKLLIEEEEGEEAPGEIRNFWEAVRIIILADLVMSLDNILAVGGAAEGHLGLLLFGLAVSIPLVLFGSSLLTQLLRKWPMLSFVGSGILAWTAGSMVVHDAIVEAQLGTLHVPQLDTGITAVCTAAVLGAGYLASRHKQTTAQAAAEASVATEALPAEAVTSDSP